MALDLETWAKDNDLTPEEAKQVAGILGEKRVPKVLEGYMRQSDYDRSMNENKATLAGERKKWDDANAEVEAGLRSVNSLRESIQADLDKGKVSWQEAERRAIALEATVKRLAVAAGEDPDEALKLAGIEAHKPADRTTDPPVDWEAREKALQERAAASTRTSFLAGIELEDVADEHRELFGTRLVRADLVAYANQQSARGRQLTPQQAWEEKYEVGKKREEVRATKEKASRDQFEKDTEARLRSELVMAGGTGRVTSGTQMASPVLRLPRKDAEGRDISAQKPEYLVRAENRVRAKMVEVQSGT